MAKIFMAFSMNETASTIKDCSQALISTEGMPLKVFTQIVIRLASCFFLQKQNELNNMRMHTQSERAWVKSKSLKLLRGDTFFPLIRWLCIILAERISVCVDVNEQKKREHALWYVSTLYKFDISNKNQNTRVMVAAAATAMERDVWRWRYWLYSQIQRFSVDEPRSMSISTCMRHMLICAYYQWHYIYGLVNVWRAKGTA